VASNEEIIRNLYAVAEKEPKRFRSLFTDDGYWWDVPAGVKYHGDDVARAADIYSAAFPDMHRELHDLYFDGDVVVVQLSLKGTHQGDLPMGMGTIPATGKKIDVPCVDVFRLEDGKVSAFDCYYAGTILLGPDRCAGQLGGLAQEVKANSSLRTGARRWAVTTRTSTSLQRYMAMRIVLISSPRFREA
jgi:ketosteroid isomerase-like protein